jgi:AmmeMemoRadiSam system protein B
MVDMLGVADATQISDKVCLMLPAVQLVLPLMDGSRGLDQIVTEVGRGLTRPVIEQIVAQLDDAGLIEGPTFAGMMAKMKEAFDKHPTLPPATTANFVDQLIADAQEQGQLGKAAGEEEKVAFGRKRLSEALDQFIAAALKEVPDPGWNDLPRGVIAPHLDYGRGWLNYASVYGRFRVAERPERVLILGTNHFGLSSGVCACDKGYETALGVCEADTELLEKLKGRLGAEGASKLLANRYDHEREHSVELHIPWIQHVFGTDAGGRYPKVLGVLVHDPAVNNGESYDGQGLSLDAFVEAMKGALGEVGGRTLIVSSADLSHCGPAFGDEAPLAGEGEPAVGARNKVFQHDQDLLGHVANRRIPELIAAMAWQQNPTRWCSTGNLIATLRLTEPGEVKLLNYAAAMDQEGMSMVTSVAGAIL